MRTSFNSKNEFADRHWRLRWLDTERRLAATSNPDLRTVYAELLSHYQRMADRYDSLSLRHREIKVVSPVVKTHRDSTSPMKRRARLVRAPGETAGVFECAALEEIADRS